MLLLLLLLLFGLLIFVWGVCVWLPTLGAEPCINNLLNKQKMALWLSWLMRYYPKGNMVCNKCQHASGFLKHLKGIEGYGDDASMRLKILQCCNIIKKQAQDGKILGMKQ